MQTLNLKLNPSPARVLTQDEIDARSIAGFFYYSSAVILWLFGLSVAAFSLFFLFTNVGMLSLFILAAIFGFPGWVWMGIGVALFYCHKNYYKNYARYKYDKERSLLVWCSTIGYNALQAGFIFYFLSSSPIAIGVGVWNLLMILLAATALYCERKANHTTTDQRNSVGV